MNTIFCLIESDYLSSIREISRLHMNFFVPFESLILTQQFTLPWWKQWPNNFKSLWSLQTNCFSQAIILDTWAKHSGITLVDTSILTIIVWLLSTFHILYELPAKEFITNVHSRYSFWRHFQCKINSDMLWQFPNDFNPTLLNQ